MRSHDPSAAGSAALSDAEWAWRIAAVDPAGIGGVRLRAGAGPARDHWLARLRDALPPGTPWRRVPSCIDDERLLGGIDLAGTLMAGRLVFQPGALAQANGGVLILSMAERCEPRVAVGIAQVVETGDVFPQHAGAASVPARIGVIALDEATPDDGALAGALSERLGIDLRLQEDGWRPDAQPPSSPHRDAIDRARVLLPRVESNDAILGGLCEAALVLGIASLRVPSLAWRVACIAAALEGRCDVRDSDAALAARLVLAPRAAAWPRGPDSSAGDEPAPDPAGAEPAQQDHAGAPPASHEAGDASDTAAPDEGSGERPLDAVAVTLPKALLESIAADAAARDKPAVASGRSGASHRSAVRGRPIGSVHGSLAGGARLDLLATLCAAAPWQAVRRRGSPTQPEGILVRRDDFRVRRYRERRESTTIFAVDASGSEALHRLAEAKGAVELLLADCYVRRDRVAVIAFRGAHARVLLAPTRSLVHARRCLTGLPGGGGTPLASGVAAASELAVRVVRDGGTPLLVLLIGGGANVALDGAGGRERAFADALAMARAWAALGERALVIDTAARAHEQAHALARAMGARYVALPDAGAPLLASSIARATSQPAAAWMAQSSLR